MNPARQKVEELERQFAEIHQSSCDFVSNVPTELLYRRGSEARSTDTCGEQILRCGAAVEQSFGGLTANLWDDPFEWTLPETLNTPAKVLEYLQEVDDLRLHAFLAFSDDSDLCKEIMTPGGPTKILPFLLDTLKRARHHQQRAFNVFAALTPDH